MARRNRGDGGLYWDETKQRWIGVATVGYDGRGKPRRRKVHARTKTEGNERLRELLREVDRGVDLNHGAITVGEVVEAWLRHGLNGRSEATLAQNRHLAEVHIIALIGKKRLRDLRAHDVDRMLAARRDQLSTSTLQRGKSMTLSQARTLLEACEYNPLGAYVSLALLLGVRNEELRALTWDHVDLVGKPAAEPPTPPSVRVWRSVRAGGDTKTRLSRRTIGLPSQCVHALEQHRSATQAAGRFRTLCVEAGLDAGEWTPRELRHSFVSLMSDAGVPLEDIARLVGHGSTKVTETVYRKQLRPVLTSGTQVMETLFDLPPDRTSEVADRS
ncbi:site-specific integrase [Nocardioides guangzhouensis]|uniref:site-specific integrase n=1 Tax=Nocardioides guangzhouensis TaxID=2497878 RepID=UPI001C375CCE|nr:site-specific integrase [Nocardioides guangzhouensis]